MNALIKTAWLTALASEAYQPSRNGHLVTIQLGMLPVYTALGVLRELARAAGVPVEPIEVEQFWLPPAVAQWAEMDTLPWMKLASPSGIFNLAHINKLGGGTFELESAAIREHL